MDFDIQETRELANMMDRRQVDILCVQDIEWKERLIGFVVWEKRLSCFIIVWMERYRLELILTVEFARNV